MLSSLINNYFFYISADDINSIKPEFYGFYIDDKERMLGTVDTNNTISWLSCGLYVNICVTDDSIIIQQDYFAGYGIYFYEHNGFWAISNSFYMLVNRLCKKRSLSINHQYIASYLYWFLVPYSLYFTAINEIHELPPHFFIVINKNSKRLQVVKIPSKTCSIPVDSRESFDIIDKWYHKWKNVASAITSSNNLLNSEITGGFDSRVCLCPLHPVSLNNPRINFYTDKRMPNLYDGDLQISSQISDILDFPLTSRCEGESIQLSSIYMLYLYLYSKFMIHGSITVPDSFYTSLNFLYTGYGGEGLRNYVPNSREKLIASIRRRESHYSKKLLDDCIEFLNTTCDILNNYYMEEIHAEQKLYTYTRIKNHFGEYSLSNLLVNTICLSPLMDPILYSIDLSITSVQDRDILFAILLDRFLPLLTHLPFDKNRSIKPETFSRASFLNSLYPTICNHDTIYNIKLKPFKFDGAFNDININLAQLINFTLSSKLYRDLLCPEYESLYNSAIYTLNKNINSLTDISVKLFNLGKLLYLIHI